MREAAKEISKLKTRRYEKFGLRNIRELLIAEVDHIDDAFHKYGEKATVRGLSTGLADLDSNTDGLHKSELIVIASRPGMGKTDLVLGIAAHASIKEKRAVAYFSLSLPADRIARRLIASLGHISSYRLLRGAIGDDDWQGLTDAVGSLAEAPLYIDESPSLTLPLLKERIERIKDEKGIELVIIDTLQHLEFQTSSERLPRADATLTKGIKDLAKEFQIPIVVTTSIRREVESRANKRPVLHDLDEKLGVEENADAVIFVYRDDVYDEDSVDKGKAELIVAKNSEGPIGTARVTYLQEYARFENFMSKPRNL